MCTNRVNFVPCLSTDILETVFLYFIPTFMNKLYTTIINIVFITLITALISLLGINPLTVGALPTVQQFDVDRGLVLSDQDFYSLPFSFNSAYKIQQFLVDKGSLLAYSSFVVSLESDHYVMDANAFASKPIQYRSPTQIGPYIGTVMTAADIIWSLARTSMSSSCAVYWGGTAWYTNDVCYDTNINPINPGFILSMIQKESGLVYGANSKLNPNSTQAQFLLDRVVGYYCFENPDPAQSCYDQNPNWRFYKGFFKQLYYSVRLLRLREQMCRIGGSYAFANSNGVFQVGNTVTINGTPIQLKNGISCSMYIYTPHISSQRLALQVMIELQIDKNLMEVKGIPPDYIPAPLILFDPTLNQEVVTSLPDQNNDTQESNTNKNDAEYIDITDQNVTSTDK